MTIKPTSYQVQVKVFEMAGCEYVRTKGDHLIYHYPGAIRPVVIPKYKEIPVFIIRNNMRIIGMPPERYFKLLQKV
jgi:predicted RNA binding protein YcfA (HicA-like mRNA interferase family)